MVRKVISHLEDSSVVFKLKNMQKIKEELIKLKAENEMLKKSNKYMSYALWIITIISTISLIGKYCP